MVTYVVYDLTNNKVAFSCTDKEKAFTFVLEKLHNRSYWPFREGRYYCPYEIHDVYVHTAECECATYCGGLPFEEGE